MVRWLGAFLTGLPGWGRVVVVVAIVALLAWAIWMGRDLSAIWGVLQD